jgi:HI0933-like protein
LYVCGECLNVDGVTGGFNFMNAWYVGSGLVGSGVLAASDALLFAALTHFFLTVVTQYLGALDT